MQKVFVLFFTLFLALASFTTYLFLTEKITNGQEQITQGEAQLAKGQQMLDQGKAKLANGKRQLSSVKTVYSGLNSIPFMGVVNKAPVSRIVMGEASKQISEGDQLVSKGDASVKSGEERIAAGKLALSRGQDELRLANQVRIASACGSAFFLLLALGLGFYWRRSLARIFKHS